MALRSIEYKVYNYSYTAPLTTAELRWPSTHTVIKTTNRVADMPKGALVKNQVACLGNSRGKRFTFQRILDSRLELFDRIEFRRVRREQ